VSKDFFKQHEREDSGFTLPLEELLDQLNFNEAGLVPAIAQQHDSGEVLMMAWMSREALEETLRSGQVCYYSRSRGTLWRKGETSGQQQALKSLRVDCDGDTVLLQVEQTGAACHTGRRDCFYWRVDGDQVVLDKDTQANPDDLYGKLPG